MKKGFTLIELLVVISIIGLLASIVVSSLGTARQQARDVARVRKLQELNTALQLFYADNGYYPSLTSSTNLVSFLNSGTKKYIVLKASDYSDIKYEALPQCFDTVSNPWKCPNYHIAIVLERSDNPVLKTDADYVANIAGKSADCSITPGPIDFCYDLVSK
jgi:prepilin-type N-terminal cleavage/methylation domain-containing protein